MTKKTVKPYEDSGDKKTQVGRMFDNIAGKYDLLNRMLSLGVDQIWRRNVTRRLKDLKPQRVLDVATGTADLAIMIQEKLSCQEVIGVDISQKMLDVGHKKIERKGLEGHVRLEWGDSENLQFPDNSFDAATVAFGVRNFGDLQLGIQEIYRILKPGAKLVVLEFSRPRLPVFKQLYDFYFSTILPNVGRWTSKDPKAYRYLYESVRAFPDYERFIDVLEDNGFSQTNFLPQTLGICCIYEGIK
ncbi:MAG: bifunctional demethylmenaquinone methyltransferase/2-methoxy-6-polyprenyl-1,4-benzoquinol methylase UbiE [Saprospiraceae bacterium]|nr:bifunctional demethylmenaquinone methyltransferase/2-methoxy-6-polyprenyl-1,4-benzoquinol methylase UbiE [Saprospiraceae bacterium]